MACLSLLGCGLLLGSRLLLFLAFRLLGRREDRVQRVAFHPRTKLHDGAVPDLFQQALEYLSSQIGMGHLATSEEDCSLHLVALLKEAQHVVLFELVVVLVHVDAELDFLDVDDLLVLLGRAFLLFFFVEKLAVILNATDRRIGRRGNLYQVESSFAGNFERLKRLQDAKLGSVFVNHTDFAGANALIGADKTLVDTFLRRILRT
jgi:hypothetical protein